MAKKDKQKLEVVVDDDSDQEQGWLVDEGEEAELLLDVYQDDKNIYVKSTIAGVEPEDIEISINNDMLTIRGTRSDQTEVSEADYFYKECYWGSFSRSIILPVEVKADEISANFKNGVLEITLPKTNRHRKIPIKLKS